LNVFAIDLKGIRPSEYDKIISLVHMQFISRIMAALTRGSILARNKGYFRSKSADQFWSSPLLLKMGTAGFVPGDKSIGA
jgi:hypothetical protein